ncbi:perforin-1-like [Gouania willdenowi]|uniref:perforin-1-like n=1 Tax=Gouania willdenowi TaxID=441366 RepID=UPI00105469DF|nr:perforin-1-like [Gouania willdenowi]
MKLTVFAGFLAIALLSLQGCAATSCAGKTVEVYVINGIGMSGDGPSRPDPYVKVTIGGLTQKTKVIRSSRNPFWWQGMVFNHANSNYMTVEVWDQDSGLRGADDHTGTCIEKLSTHGKKYTNVHCKIRHNGLVNLKYKCY